MKVRVEKEKCMGHGMCAIHAPGIFELDDLGFNQLDGEMEVGDAHGEAVVNAVKSCPERAIELVEAPVVPGAAQ